MPLLRLLKDVFEDVEVRVVCGRRKRKGRMAVLEMLKKQCERARSKECEDEEFKSDEKEA